MLCKPLPDTPDTLPRPLPVFTVLSVHPPYHGVTALFSQPRRGTDGGLEPPPKSQSPHPLTVAKGQHMSCSTSTTSTTPRRRSPRKDRSFLLVLKPSQKAKRPRKLNPPEYLLQNAVAGFLDMHPCSNSVWFHYPSGGFRDKKTARLLKKSGAKPGVPDVMIFRPFTLDGRSYNGLAIELKKLGANGPSPCQDHWLRSLYYTGGWLCALGRTFKDVRGLIERVYGPLPPLNPDKSFPPFLVKSWESGGFNVDEEPRANEAEGNKDAPPNQEDFNDNGVAELWLGMSNLENDPTSIT